MYKILLAALLAASPLTATLAASLTATTLTGKDVTGATQYFGQYQGTIASQANSLIPMVIFCDATTVGQCAAVNSSGQISVNPSTLISPFGSSFPTSGSAIGVSSSGNMVAPVICDHHAYSHITSSGNTLLVQGVTSQTVKVCGFVPSFSGSAAQGVYLENTASTNANCTSTLTQISGLITGNSTAPGEQGFYNPTWGGLVNTSGNGLCVNASGSGGVDVDVWYTQGS